MSKFLDKEGLTRFWTKAKSYIDSKSGNVTSFNGRTGAITPQSSDYTPSLIGAVPTTRTIDGKALSSNVTILPTGGSAGQVLTKSSATNYAVQWSTLSATNEVYSTTETRIGTWMNSKPVYRKTLIGTCPSSPSTSGARASIGWISNIDIPIELHGVVKRAGTNGFFPIPYIEYSKGAYITMYNFSGEFAVYFFQDFTTGSIAGQPIYITCVYTRTID